MTTIRNRFMDKKSEEEILRRLARLERVIFGAKKERHSPEKLQNFSGPTGGVRLMVSNGFFKVKRNLNDVRNALAKAGYHYGAAQVQTALNRLSRRDGLLVASRQAGKKIYVIRK